MEAPNLLERGTTVDGRYEVIVKIADGGMGGIYKATEVGLDRTVAIKIVHSGLLDSEGLARFERESKILAELSHPNIVTFYRFGRLSQHGLPFIVTEYLEGVSLRSVLDDCARLPAERAIQIALQVCRAMSFAHDKGIVHRDLKPNNIMLKIGDTDFVKVLDFGLARHTGSQKLTHTGCLIGSVFYMSPEQWLGQPSDERSDVYSLSCVLYEMISGQLPFMADNPISLMHKHATEEPPGIATVAGSNAIPPGLATVIERGMTKSPDCRYQSMNDLARELELVTTGRGNEIARMAQSKVRSRFRPASIVLFCVAILTCGAMLLKPSEKKLVLPSSSDDHRIGRLIDDVNRLQRNYETRQKRGSPSSLARLRLDKIRDLRETLWHAGRFNEYFALFDVHLASESELDNRGEAELDTFNGDFGRLTNLILRDTDPKREGWQKLQQKLLQDLHKRFSKKDLQSAKVVELQGRCIASMLAGRISEAVALFNASWSYYQTRSEKPSSIQFYLGVSDWRYGRMLDFLRVLKDVSRLGVEQNFISKSEILPVAEIISRCAGYLELSPFVNSRDMDEIRLQRQATLRLLLDNYTVPANDLALKKRFTTLVQRLKKPSPETNTEIRNQALEFLRKQSQSDVWTNKEHEGASGYREFEPANVGAEKPAH